MKKIIGSLLILSALAFVTPRAFADSGCNNVYGASCPTGNISLDKKVRHPQSGEYLDTISSTDTTFLPEQEVKFKIDVKNTGSADLVDVWVDDKFPDFVEFVSGTGNYDKNTHKLWWKIDRINAGEVKSFEIRVKLKNASDLPNMAITCMTNHSKAVKDHMTAQDTASFCVQSKILGTTTELPKTGAGSFELLTGISIISSLLALGFAKRSVKA